MADLVGQTLGNYRIESRLGSGGMGDVYRAVHIHLNRPAAIKVLHANQAEDPTFRARFLREARAAAALSHPNIVEVLDFGEQHGDSYLVMELIPDGSLRMLLRQRATGRSWPLGLGIDLVRQAAEGLAYAHAHGMVHRDIKPDNLLLERLTTPPRFAGSESYLLKISDFGLARLMEDSGELTQTGVVMGTPTYMSPEQCQGGALDGRSDLYSLGVVLYEVATGTPPFRVKTLSEAVFKHISAPPTPPRSVLPDLPPALDEVIMRCLAKLPEDRYANGSELADALAGALGDAELRTMTSTLVSTELTTPSPVPVAVPVVPPTPLSMSADDSASTIATSAQSLGATRLSDPPAPSKSPPGDAVRTSLVVEDDATLLATPTPSLADAPVSPDAPSAPPASERASAAPAPQSWPPASNPPPPTGLRALSPRARIGAGVAALVVVALLVTLLTHALIPAQNAGGAHSVSHARVTPTASPTPVETIVYQAPLTSATRDWPISAHSFFASGGYVLSGAWIAYAPGDSFHNGSVSVQMRQLRGPTDQFYGLLLRGANNNLYYFFGLNGSQQWTFSLVRNGNGQPITPPATDLHINVGANASNTITVRAVGSHFIFYVNGAQVGQSDNSAIASGSLGLINTVGNLTVVYNNFTVTA